MQLAKTNLLPTFWNKEMPVICLLRNILRFSTCMLYIIGIRLIKATVAYTCVWIQFSLRITSLIGISAICLSRVKLPQCILLSDCRNVKRVAISISANSKVFHKSRKWNGKPSFSSSVLTDWKLHSYKNV